MKALRPPTSDLRPLTSALFLFFQLFSIYPVPPTLANRLGTSTHLSPLLQKAKRLGVSSPEDLEEIAITRGLRYFGQTHRSEDDPYAKSAITAYDPKFFTNEELAIALMSPALPYSLTRLRMAAAMLGAENISPLDIYRLARHERCEIVVRYIAECASKVEPNNLFWSTLLEHLPQSQFTPPDVLPHPSRFVAMSGLDRTVRANRSQWIRPTS